MFMTLTWAKQTPSCGLQHMICRITILTFSKTLPCRLAYERNDDDEEEAARERRRRARQERLRQKEEDDLGVHVTEKPEVNAQNK